jgi:hypothetical protein
LDYYEYIKECLKLRKLRKIRNKVLANLSSDLGLRLEIWLYKNGGTKMAEQKWGNNTVKIIMSC